jgi:hypothetical protein
MKSLHCSLKGITTRYRIISHRTNPAHAARQHTRPSSVVVAAAESRAYSNPLGVHSLVWCGEWDEAAARRAAVGSAAAGFNLVEIPAFDAAR